MHDKPDSTPPPPAEAASAQAGPVQAAHARAEPNRAGPNHADPGHPTLPDLPPLPYDCARDRLPPQLAARFMRLRLDEEGQATLLQLRRTRPGTLRTTLFRGLRRTLSDYDAYGLLGMYGVHMLSAAQLAVLIGRAPEHTPPRGHLLDVGAGNGDALAPCARLFERWHATEQSSVMRRRLRARGATVHAHNLEDAPLPGALRFDVIACLNLIDRTRFPKRLLQHARDALSPGGLLLVAVPLPLRPHVDLGRITVDQEQPLPANDTDDWEAAAARLHAELLTPLHLRVRTLSRVPYICQGDATRPWHVLDDVLFVCEAEP